MVFQKLQKTLAIALAASLVATSVPGMDYTRVLAADKQTAKDTDTDDVSADDDGVFKVTMDDTGYITADEDNVAANVNTPFSWDNVNMYFVITDRFENGDKTNDHAYGRSTKEKGAENYENRIGTFHGGDLAGMTKKIEDGYFDELGTNAIWITAPYEQIHGALCSTKFKHYAYHGYYVLDYTNVDGNMGTAEDLEKFIDTAHEHGIRVVFDIVMNHAGYADAYTANEYGFGKLADNWEEIYYNWDESQYDWYNDYAGEASKQGSQGMMVADGDWTTNWWGTSWIRAIGERLNGYQGSEGGPDELTQCLNGLPDFKVETSGDPGIPAILKNKWTKEGNYDEKVEMTKSSMSKGGLNASVTGYICAWLSQWVREYGVDGFRCDTAKHVPVSEWVKLKDSCKKALNEWRTNNPDKPGAKWTDDFWMTGEHWDHGVGKDNYYTSGAFDSMINFKYKGNESKTGAALEDVFSGYASQINEDPSFNVLSYISSHDTSLGARSASAGTALLLTPGGVQTYYGDESGRTAGEGSGDQPTRSHMNWSSTNTTILSNWQKVGQFRRNHIAVGAGKHTKIADSPYTFSRTYTGKATVGSEQKTDYKDAVVVCLPGKATTTDVTVGDTFGDATTVRDAYSGETYEISDGKVSGVTCDSNGVILLEVPSEGGVTSKSSVSVSPSGKTYNDDTVKVTLNAKEATDTFYQINDSEKIAFKDGDTVEIGGDTAYEEETIIKVTGKGTDSEGNAIDLAKEAKFTRGKEPAVGAESGDFLVRVKKSDFEEAPQIYVYDDTHKWAETGDTAYTGAWPGKTMTAEGDYYVYRNEEIKTPVKAIVFTADESWRSTPDKKDPDPISGTVELVKGASSGTFEKVEISTGEKCKVTIKYVDKATGKSIKEIYRVGEEGAEYNTYPLVAPESGYKLEATPENATGKFTKDEITVTYNYVASDVTPEPATPTPTVPATTGPVITATPTAEPSATPDVTATPTAVPSGTPEVTPTADPTNPPLEDPATEAPTPTAVVTTTPSAIPSATPTVEPSATPVVFAAKISTSPASKQVAGKVVTIKASAQGTTGSCTYKYVVENSAGSQVFKKGYSSSKSCSWKPDKAGTYVITVYVKDAGTGMISTAEKSFKVSSAALVLKKLSAVNLGKLKVKLTATTTGGSGTVKYKFTYKYNGKTKVLKSYSKTSSFKKVFKKAGTYKFTVYVKDSTNKVKKKTVTLKVKK